MEFSDANISQKSTCVPIAPAPAQPPNIRHEESREEPQGLMAFTCQPCSKRKVKCSRETPTCSTCRKSKIECVYEAPPPRRRKRKMIDDVNDRLAQYEALLLQHGILPNDGSVPTVRQTEQHKSEESSHSSSSPLQPTMLSVLTAQIVRENNGSTVAQSPVMSLSWNEPEALKQGRFKSEEGRSRYIGSHIWRNLDDDEVDPALDDSDNEDEQPSPNNRLTADPLTGALLGGFQGLLQYHPTQPEAMLLWRTHCDNVEPLVKILHIPTVSIMVESVSQQPVAASKTEECLLFAIYYFAVVSMTDEECEEKIGHSRKVLMQDYHFASRQALVNASFLKTTEMVVLQALVLFLVACRYTYDPNTYWILTGVAVRIGQRIGLHRDGQALGLSPFEVQMRRRLFYQIIPLDGIASQLSGTGVGIMADSWDTQVPWNVNDDQIWPGMTEKPKEQKAATEMIYCLTKACIGTFVAKSGKAIYGLMSGDVKDLNDVEGVISRIEAEVEDRYIRYCDIVNPLHFIAVGIARTAMVAMRLRIRMHKIREGIATDYDRKDAFTLSQKILETDSAAHAHSGLSRFKWHIGKFFAWGSWDAFIYILTFVTSDKISTRERDGAWVIIEQLYNNHPEMMEAKQALHVAGGRLVVKAWDTKPASGSIFEPTYISQLRSLRDQSARRRLEKIRAGPATIDSAISATSSLGLSGANDSGYASCLDSALTSDTSADLSPQYFDLDAADWMFWDKLIQDYHTQGGVQ